MGSRIMEDKKAAWGTVSGVFTILSLTNKYNIS